MILQLPRLRNDQAAIVNHPAKVKIVCEGRRAGKTFMAGSTALACAAHGAQVAWIAPTYKSSRPLWRFCEQMTAPVVGRLRVNRTEREVEFPGGGRIGIYTADNDVSIRGNAFDLVIVDEAAQIREETWTDVLMPTLADRDGRALLISTPKGRNWFWREFVKAQSEGRAFQSPSSVNPLPSIQRAFQMARTVVSERTYRQEWLAEFVDDGSFFQNVRACATATLQERAIARHRYTIGVDWARAAGGDWTVFCVVDETAQSAVCLERFNGMAFDLQLRRLTDLCNRFGRPPVVAEYNSLGGPLVESLQASGLPVTGFTTTGASKHDIISLLELALDRQEIRLLPQPDLLLELEAYEKHERAGLPSYSAPTGMHDDCVMALALAWGYAHAEREYSRVIYAPVKIGPDW